MRFWVETKNSFTSNSNMMKDLLRFISRFSFFILTLCCVVSFYFYFFVGNLSEEELIGSGVYHTIRKSKKIEPKAEVILIGDSIGNQIYNNKDYNDRIYSLCSNQAISMVGQYNLLKNFLETNKRDSLEVVLIYRLSSFRNDLRQNLTFNYFIKPFYKREYLENYSQNVLRQIKKIPGYWLVHSNTVRMSRWSPSVQSINNPNNFRLSDISVEYLIACDKLCEKYNASFKLVAPFMSNEFSMNDFGSFQESIVKHNLQTYFSKYFQNIVWLDKKYFSDKSHIKKDLISELLGKNFLNL